MSVSKAYARGQSLSQSEEEHTCTSTDSISPLEPYMEMLCCHSVQDSLLSSNSRFTNYRGILNWIVILLSLTYAHLFLENFIQHGFLIDLKKALELLIGDSYWPYLYLISAANVFPVICMVLEKSQEKGSLSSSLACWLHMGIFGLLAAFPTIIILHYKTSLSTGGALLSLFIYTILWLKLYSYQQVSSWYREKEHTDGGKHHQKSDNITLCDLYYFLLAPTLCYQRNFPQTHRVRLNFVLQSLVEMVIFTQLIVGIMQQWIDPIFQRSKKSFADMEIAARIEHLVELATPTHFLWLMFFFLFSHSYLNFIAELLCFGDRHFYGDWWNADTLGSFWRNWNVPFQKWIQRHLYDPFLKTKLSTKQADVLIFTVVSALLEYNIALALQRCNLWLFLNMMFELLLAFVLGRFFIGNYGNGLVWLCLLLGPPLAVTTYYHDHYMSQRGLSDDLQSVRLKQEEP